MNGISTVPRSWLALSRCLIKIQAMHVEWSLQTVLGLGEGEAFLYPGDDIPVMTHGLRLLPHPKADSARN